MYSNFVIFFANNYFQSLLSKPSTREKQNKQVGEEILELLSKPTAKERSLAEKFKSQGGAQVMEFCPHGTRIECLRAQQATDELEAANKKAEAAESESTTLPPPSSSTIITTILPTMVEEIQADVVIIKCKKLHFKKIIQSHTDESLGDCSFLNTCFHMDTCK